MGGRVPIVNNARRMVVFERQASGRPSGGTITLKPGETFYERGVHLTYETLALKAVNGDFTDQRISTDELDDDNLYEKIEVIYDDTVNDFRLVKHPTDRRRNRTLTQTFSDMFSTVRSLFTGDTLPR